MIGITGYGSYIPYNRLKASTVAETFGKRGKKDERAVAYYDEDSITMAVEAALTCLKEGDEKKLDSVYFATTTSPYQEKQGSASVAAAIDANREVRLADFTDSLRCSAAALLSAFDAAEKKSTLVAIGDCRLGGADGANETAFGDAAAAFTVGSENVLAQVIDTYSVGLDYPDTWRAAGDTIVRNWDVRYALSLTYEPVIQKAVAAFLAKTGLTAADFSKVILYAHEKRHQVALAAKMGFAPEQIQECMYAQIGNTGCAAAPLMLTGALETAKPGDKILYIAYGEGCDVIAFEATEAITSFQPAVSLQIRLDTKSSDLTYGKYLKWKGMLECEPQKRPDQERSSLPDFLRNYKKNTALYGSRCTCCGTPQFPPQRICAKCGAWDQMEAYRFYGKNAWVKTFTLDGLSLSQDSPNNLVVVEFEGGGKMMTFMVGCQASEIYVGMPVDCTFRKMFTANGIHTYFWKVAPKRVGGEQA